MSAAYITRHREALQAEDAERLGVGSKWAERVRRNLQRHVDARLLYDASLGLQTVYLQRWSPETRALIQQARAAVTAAMRAVYRELP